MSLTLLDLSKNSFSGAVLSFFSKLTKFHSILLYTNNFATDVPPDNIYNNKEKVQTYLFELRCRSMLTYYLINGIYMSNPRPPSTDPRPFFFLSAIEDVTKSSSHTHTSEQ